MADHDSPGRAATARGAARLDFGQFEALTFDCYGTLIDWEAGMLAAFRPVLDRARLSVADDTILEAYARHEAELEDGPFRKYRDVLAGAFVAACDDFGVTATDSEARAFADSVGDWPAFPDSEPALRRLATRFRLGVITNCDDDLFAASNRRLGVTFDWVVTAEQVGAYKPDERNFRVALERIGLPRERILHVAQSLYHDHVPAQRLGLATAWIDRRRGRSGPGATPPATATPDVTAPDLATFAELALR